MKFTLCVASLVGFVAYNSYSAEYQSPRILGLGGAGRALPTLNDSIYQNPGYASLAPLYSLSTGYRWFNRGRNYNISIQDSRTELFQAGVGFTRREQNSAINVGAAKKAMQNLGIGAGFKIILDDQTGKMTTDSLFGAEFVATPWYYSGLVVDNIFQSKEAIARNLYRTIYLANRFEVFRVVQLFIDPHYSHSYPGKKAGFSGGIEFSLLADFQLRLGRFLNTPQPHMATRGDGFGVGFGWVGPKISIEYAYHRVTENDAALPVVSSNAAQINIFF